MKYHKIHMSVAATQWTSALLLPTISKCPNSATIIQLHDNTILTNPSICIFITEVLSSRWTRRPIYVRLIPFTSLALFNTREYHFLQHGGLKKNGQQTIFQTCHAVANGQSFVLNLGSKKNLLVIHRVR